MTTHADAVHEMIASFCHNKKFTDCVFVVGKYEKEYPAIKALLAMQSEYFEAMLFNKHFNSVTKSSTQHKGINHKYDSKSIATYYEPDVTATAFEFIIQYCYGVADAKMPKVIDKNVLDIYYAANKYLIKPIKNICINFLNEAKFDKNFMSINILYDAARYGLTDLESKLIEIFKTKVTHIIDDPLVLQLPYSWFSELFVKNKTSQRLEESEIFDICVKYCKNCMSSSRSDHVNQSACDGSNTKEMNNIVENNINHHLSLDNDDQDNTCDENKADAERSSYNGYDYDDNHTVKQNFDTWQSMMRSLFIPLIDFSAINKRYLSTKVRESKLLSQEELWDIVMKWSFGEQLGLIKYTITMNQVRYSSVKNYIDLISDDCLIGATTEKSFSPFIQATFAKKYKIHWIQVAPPAPMMNNEHWNLGEIHGSRIEYLDETQDEEKWVDMGEINGLEIGVKKTFKFHCQPYTKAIRIAFHDVQKQRFLGIGCLRVHGENTDQC